jgi:hypothetical protein
MKIFLDDIKKIGWLESCLLSPLNDQWARNFLNLKKGFYFVFNYNLNESDSSIKIINSKSLYQINEGIYKNLMAEHIGYMREPFDSSSYLFFSMLKSACITQDDKHKLTNLFISYKAQDIA